MKVGANMPHGGARKGAGRKPTPLYVKLGLEGLPNQLKMEETPRTRKPAQKPKPPEYLSILHLNESLVPSPVEIFNETANYLHYGSNRYTDIVMEHLIADYAVMAHFSAAILYAIEDEKSKSGYETDEKTAIAHADTIIKIMECKRLAWKPIQDIINRKTDMQTEFSRKYKAEIDASWAEAALYKKSQQAQFHEKKESKT